MLNLLQTEKHVKEDFTGITLGWPDKPGHFDSLNTGDNDSLTHNTVFVGGTTHHIIVHLFAPLLADGNQCSFGQQI